MCRSRGSWERGVLSRSSSTRMHDAGSRRLLLPRPGRLPLLLSLFLRLLRTRDRLIRTRRLLRNPRRLSRLRSSVCSAKNQPSCKSEQREERMHSRSRIVVPALCRSQLIRRGFSPISNSHSKRRWKSGIAKGIFYARALSLLAYR